MENDAVPQINVLAQSAPTSAWRVRIRYVLYPKSDRDIRRALGDEIPDAFVFDWFEGLSLLMILANTICLALTDPLNPESKLSHTLDILDLVFTVFFGVETALRLMAFGLVIYKVDKWNVADTLIVVGGLVASPIQFASSTQTDSVSFTSLRTVRVLRPIRSLRMIAAARILTVSTISAVKSLGDVTLLYILFLMVFGAGGVSQYNARIRTRCVNIDYYNPNITENLTSNANLTTIRDYVRFQAYDFIKYKEKWPYWQEMEAKYHCKYNISLKDNSAAPYFDCDYQILWADCANFINASTGTIDIPPRNFFWLKELRKWEPPPMWLRETWENQACDGTNALILKGYKCPYGYACAEVGNPYFEKLGFDNLAMALLTLFTCVTLQVWYDIMYMTMDAVDPTTGFYFVFVIILGVFFIVNLSVALITVEFQHVSEAEKLKLAEESSTEAFYVYFFRRRKEQLVSVVDRVPTLSKSVQNNVHEVLYGRYGVFLSNFFIFANTALMATEYYGMSEKQEEFLDIMHLVFTIIFTIELLLRIIGTPFFEFISSPLCLLDFVVVAFSWGDFVIKSLHAPFVRALRALRLLNIFKSFPVMYRWIEIIVKSLKSSFILMVMIFFCLFVFSSFGMHLFGGKFCNLAGDPEGGFDNTIAKCPNRPRGNYDDIVTALLTSFILMSADGWEIIMLNGMRARGNIFCLYFVVLFVISNYVLLNLLIGILLNVRTEEEHEREREQREHDLLEQRMREEKNSGATGDGSSSAPLLLLPSGDATAGATDGSKGAAHSAAGAVEGRPASATAAAGSDEDALHLPSATQLRLRKFLSHFYFEAFIVFVIFLSSLCMALESPIKAPDATSEAILRACDYAFNLVFYIEVILQMAAYGVIQHKDAYLRRDRWNVFDFLIVALSFVGELLRQIKTGDNTAPALRAIRVLRAVRPIRFVKRSDGLRIVIDALIKALAPLRNLMVVIFVIFTMWGIMGVQLFKGTFYSCSNPNYIVRAECTAGGGVWMNAQNHFDNLGAAFLSLITITTLEGWAPIMYNGMDAVGPNIAPQTNNQKRMALYFISFVVVGGFFFVNLFISIIVDAYQKEKKQTSRGSRFLTPQQNAWLRSHRCVLSHVPLIDYDEYERYSRLDQQFVFVRAKVRVIVRHPLFDVFIYCCIAVNFLVMAVDQYPKTSLMATVVIVSNSAFTIIFSIEAVLKITSEGFRRYIMSKWNRFDFVIVSLSLMALILEFLFAQATFAASFRSMRVLRLLRLIRKSRRLQGVLKKFLFALYSLNNVAAVLILLFFVFGVMGVKLFGRVQWTDKVTHRANFVTIQNSMLLLMRVSTGGDWGDIMAACAVKEPQCDDQLDACGLPIVANIYFVLFIIVSMFVLLNLFVAVILESFASTGHDVDFLPECEALQFFRLWLHFDPEKTYRMDSRFFLTLLRAVPPECSLSMGELPVRRRLQHEFVFVEALGIQEFDGKIELEDIVYALCRKAYKAEAELPETKRRRLVAKSGRRFRSEERSKYRSEDKTFLVAERLAVMIIEAYWEQRKQRLANRKKFEERMKKLLEAQGADNSTIASIMARTAPSRKGRKPGRGGPGTVQFASVVQEAADDAKKRREQNTDNARSEATNHSGTATATAVPPPTAMAQPPTSQLRRRTKSQMQRDADEEMALIL